MVAIGVVLPCYRVRRHVGNVVSAIGSEVARIYVVDDACPESSGRWVEENVDDSRVQVLYLPQNRGVGAAMIRGYRQALSDGMEVVVKIDGDGQMDPSLIYRFVRPIVAGEADYTKGNRFYSIERLRQMPWIRLTGNAILSFVSKLATGYWELFDPTNGFTAVHARVLELLPLEKISRRYFFESDMLFRLNTVRALVLDVPMESRYGDEVSNLRIGRSLWEFAWKNSLNTGKRIFYNYFLRGFSLASIELLLGVALMSFGLLYGASEWLESYRSGTEATSGAVMIAALPIILGMQFLLGFIGFDMQSSPRTALHRRL